MSIICLLFVASAVNIPFQRHLDWHTESRLGTYGEVHLLMSNAICLKQYRFLPPSAPEQTFLRKITFEVSLVQTIASLIQASFAASTLVQYECILDKYRKLESMYFYFTNVLV